MNFPFAILTQTFRVFCTLALFGLPVRSQAQPRLSVTSPTPMSVQLSWPGAEPGFQLEATSQLGSAANWQSVALAPVLNAGQYTVMVQAGEITRFFRLRSSVARLTSVVETSPASGESGVAVTRETIFRFSAPLAPDMILDSESLFAEFAGRQLLARLELSSDRKTATLFYLENLPASTRVRVILDGAQLRDESGKALDADGDGQPGGLFQLGFTTSGTFGLPDTAVAGQVFASEKNADGSNKPLSNVTITVDGAEETLRTTTDAAGRFTLMPAPAGRFFVHVDGRTAIGSQWPGGAYYPFVGKAWEAIPGRTNNLAGGSGEVFLPLIQADALRSVSATEETKITFSASALAANPALAGVEITVPANSLFSENGARGGKVGIAAVPPDRLPEPLPAGLDLPLVITIQTDGPMNFDRPVPVRFPNLPDPVTGVKLPPGAKTVLWSFNHDTGRWEAQGTATISGDGNFAETDPGVGVRQPGWHGVAPGSPGSGPEGCKGDDCDGPKCGSYPPTCCASWDEKTKPCEQKQELGLNAIQDFALDGLLTSAGIGGCGLGSVLSTVRVARDCTKVGQFSSECGSIAQDGAIGNTLGCIPVVGSVFSLGWGGKSMIDGYFNFRDCLESVVQACAGAPVGTASLPKSPLGSGDPRLERAMAALNLQIEVSEACNNSLARILGSPRWASADSPEAFTTYQKFMVAIQNGVGIASPGGRLLTAEERSAVLALPRPNGATASQASALMDRLEGFGQGNLQTDLVLRAEVAAGFEILAKALEKADGRGWSDLLDGFRVAMAEYSSMSTPGENSESSSASPQSTHAAGLHAVGAAAVDRSFASGPLYYLLQDLQTGFKQRGRLSSAGRFVGIFLRPDSYYSAAYLDPKTGRHGVTVFRSSAANIITEIPSAPLIASLSNSPTGPKPDSDQDGLPDQAEAIIGTSPVKADTDGDGISDGAEVRSDTNPLDGFTVKLGLLSSTPLPVPISWIRAENNIAVGVGANPEMIVLDIEDPLQPVILSRTSIAAPSISTLALTWPHALVGTMNAAILFDLSDPMNPIQKWANNMVAVGGAIAFGRVFICNGQSLLAYDLESGEPVRTITGVQGSYRDFRVLGDQLITTVGTTLEIFRLSEGGDRLQSAGKILQAGWGGYALFVEPGYAYVGSANGYYVIDIDPPATPAIVARPGTRTVFSYGIAKDSGNRLNSITQSSRGPGRLVSVYDQSSPTVATNFLTSLATPSTFHDVFIYRGRLLSGGEVSRAGVFEVFNYREPDFGTNPPSIQLRSYTFIDNPPIERSAGWFRLTALAQDDVVVRNVEFHLDGKLASDDGSHPFEADLRAPEFSAQKTSFTVRARAFDLAGSAAWSDTITIGLTNELIGPRLVSYTPPTGSLGLPGTVFEVTARFTETILASTLAGGLQVTAAGADEKFDTTDDQPVPFTTTLLSSHTHRINLNQPFATGYYRIVAGTNLTDFSGNRLATPTNWIFGIREPLLWVGGDGNWDDTNHWNSARRPRSDDFVRIDPPVQAEITFKSSNGLELFAHEIYAAKPVIFQDHAILELGHEAVFRALVKLGSIPGNESVTLRGGRSVYQGGLEINKNLYLADHTLIIDSPGIPSRVGNHQIILTSYTKRLGSRFIIERGSTLEVLRTNLSGFTFAWNAPEAENQSGNQFINRGVVRKLGRGEHSIRGNFYNEGTLLIEEGTLRTEAIAPKFENLGTIDIRPGATFWDQGGYLNIPSHHGRTARFVGTGTNLITGSVDLEPEYTFAGTTFVEGGIEFRGGVRSAGSWQIGVGGGTVRGLVADFAGPVTLGVTNGARGSLTFLGSSAAVLHDLTVQRGDIRGEGLVRVLSPMTVANSFRIGGNGLLTLRFENVFNSVGRPQQAEYFQADYDRVEFVRDVHWVSGPIALNTNCVVLAGATFFAESAVGTTNLARDIPGLAIEGTYKQNGAGTNQIQRLINSGLLEISAGVLSSDFPPAGARPPAGFNQNVITQTKGELRLSGGSIESHAGTAPGGLEIFGGTVTGFGKITGNIVLAGGALKPGLPVGILEINNNLDIRADGTLAVDIAGAEPGVSHDQIRVFSRVDLRGRLEINLLNGFAPQIGQEFTIATFTRLGNSTEFPEVTGQNIGNGKRFDLVYSNTSLILRVVAAP